ncbi:zinc ribbon domain-containing protein [Breznakia sp. PFB1-11]
MCTVYLRGIISEWECSSCHSYHDRDINAAINIHQHGLAI